MDIQIINEANAISTCENIESICSKQDSLNAELRSKLSQLSQAWETTGNDKITHVTQLETLIKASEELTTQSRNLASYMKNYAEIAMEISKKEAKE